MKTNAGLKTATVQYAKTRPVFEQYKATKYSRKFLAEHEADLELYRAAQAEMRSLLGGAKLSKMDVLKEEGRKLTAKKKQLYGEYQKARRDMQEIVTISLKPQVKRKFGWKWIWKNTIRSSSVIKNVFRKLCLS